MYEMLVGELPFSKQSVQETYECVLNHKETFEIPVDAELSDNAMDLIRRLVCPIGERASFADLQSHPFFKSTSWETMRDGSVILWPCCSVVRGSLPLSPVPYAYAHTSTYADPC